MQANQQWWVTDPSERYWFECTYRNDIGADLNAPQTSSASHRLLKEVKQDDIVLHYDANAEAIVGWSLVAGPAVDAQVVWKKSDGTTSMGPGWRVPLNGLNRLSAPVTLADLRQHQDDIVSLGDRLKAQHVRLFIFHLSAGN